MRRVIVGVMVGYALWTAVWLGGNAIIFKDIAASISRGEPYMKPGPYAGVLLLSVICSLAGGMVAAVIAGARARSASLILGSLLLVTGVGVQIGVWKLMPMWYHLGFLGALFPVTVVGARLRLLGSQPG